MSVMNKITELLENFIWFRYHENVELFHDNLCDKLQFSQSKKWHYLSYVPNQICTNIILKPGLVKLFDCTRQLKQMIDVSWRNIIQISKFWN